jgi:hypothetical protein
VSSDTTPAIEWGSAVYIIRANPLLPPGDITGDGLVNIDDLLAVINAWGHSGGPADLTNDGIVNIDDLLFVITHWT